MKKEQKRFLDLSTTNWGEVKNHNYDLVVLPW